jgi:AbrB family looped-hinge helix DNA binding protein
MKATLKITSKGQVTLRKELLAQLGVQAGDRVVVEAVGSGRLEIRRAEPLGSLAGFVGRLRSPTGPTLSLEDIDKLAHEGWAGGQ